MKTICTLAFCLFVCMSGFSQEITIDSLQIKKHIQYLASDKSEGRYPGTKSEKKASEYILKQLKAVPGSKPLFKGGYQDFSVEIKSKKDTLKPTIMLNARNVAVMVKGTTLPDEYIVIGAHYDHLGMGGSGSGSRRPDTIAVHNGADDNASGVAVMMACAKAIAKQNTARSLVFVAFSAEEKGLLGSKYFIEHSPIPPEKIKAMINFDMVGRLDSILYIEGTGTATQFDSLITANQHNTSFQIQRSPGGYGPSDQSSFYAEKIPVLFFHTSIHDQYHTPFDDWQLINMPGAAQVGAFATKLIVKIANNNQPLTYFATNNPMEMSRSGMKVTLGIMPDHASGGGLRISATTEGKPAARAGLKKGDIIVSIQGEKVIDIESYMKEMSKHSKGDIIIIDILRNNQKQIVTVNL